MNDRKIRIKEFVEYLENQQLVKKYLYDYPWLSGSSTMVYPITIWRDCVEVQWNSDKKIFDKFIQRIVSKNNDLIASGYFWKTDGSCPSKIIFRFN